MKNKIFITAAIAYLVTLGIYIDMNSPRYYLSLIPENVTERFKKDGWEIEYNEKINKAGIINFKNKKITIKDNKSILHEFGHYALYECDIDIEEVYDLEKNNLELNDYYTSDKDEYFAEIFSQYLLNKKTIGENVPKTVAAVEKCISKL